MSRESDVLVERDGSVAIVFINRPDRLNAVIPETGGRLREAMVQAATDPTIRSVVLSGSGRGFCAGADIKDGIDDAETVLREQWNPLITAMSGLEVPIIAAVNGVAAGAGVSLALACDLRLAARSARFQLSFVKIGLMPDTGATWLLPRVVGLGRANELALLGGDLSAEEAHSWGLVNQITEDGAVLSAAVELGKRFDTVAASVAAIKRAHRLGLQVTLTEQLSYEAKVQGQLQRRPDFSEAVTAFAQKRQPLFGPRQ